MSTNTSSLMRRKMRRIFTALKSLELIPGTTIVCSKDDEVTNFVIEHKQEYVPDFSFRWSPTKEHYLVYIKVADTMHAKSRAGYCICTVGSGLAAAGFITMYSFLHKNRANNKSEAQ